MPLLRHSIIIPLVSLVLAGCVTNDGKLKDEPLSQTQQDMVLSHARAPQQFGFKIYQVEKGISFFGQARLHPNHFVSADLIEGSIPAIKMRGRSKRNNLTALIDTSSPVSWMEFSTARQFGAIFMGINDMVIPYRGTYNTGGMDAYAAVMTQMRIENLFIEDMPFYIRMSEGSLGPLARGIRKPNIDAIVGYDNLSSFEYIQFDLKNKKIHFSASQPYEPNEDRLLDIAKISKVTEHGLAIEGKIDDKSRPIVLDFAGDFHLARGDVKVATTRTVQLGHMSLPAVPTLLLPVHAAPPRVGRKFLSPYLITICNREGKVYFERQPEK